MPLKGTKPKNIQKRLKAFWYGSAKVGKTIAAIQFPNPYLIDTEKGAENNRYTSLLEEHDGAIFQCNDIEDIIKEIYTLLSERHSYKTLIIDPITPVYDNLLEECAKKVGTEFGRHYGEANKRMKHLLTLLLRLDMNIIVTAHAKNLYGKDLAVLGQTFDGYKKLDYLFDLIIEVQRRGKERYGIVKGTRLEGFVEDESFVFNYDNISKKYNKELMEKEAKPEDLASPEQIKDLTRLINILKIEEEVINKWLSKAEASSFEEMSNDNILKCIVHLEDKIDG